MVENVTIDLFQAYLDQDFLLVINSELNIVLKLKKAEPLVKHSESQNKIPFSLLFSGPRDPQLPQAIYEFNHPEMASIGIFIVPIGADQDCAYYEAIFS